jgi:hypothetical protein
MHGLANLLQSPSICATSLAASIACSHTRKATRLLLIRLPCCRRNWNTAETVRNYLTNWPLRWNEAPQEFACLLLWISMPYDMSAASICLPLWADCWFTWPITLNGTWGKRLQLRKFYWLGALPECRAGTARHKNPRTVTRSRSEASQKDMPFS